MKSIRLLRLLRRFSRPYNLLLQVRRWLDNAQSTEGDAEERGDKISDYFFNGRMDVGYFACQFIAFAAPSPMQTTRGHVFKIIIEECEEGGYVASCPAFSGCHIEADTYETAIIEIKAAIEAFIEDYKEHDEPIPEDNFTIASVLI